MCIRDSVWIAIAAVIFIVGLFYENVAAILLAAAAVGAVVYGASMQWEPVLWFIVILFIILPIAISAILYVLAAREQAAEDAGGKDTAYHTPEGVKP